jgi:GNAT superfamily N-acetyltransferase
VAGPVEAARRRWDPDMAAAIAAHVTLVYPREAPDPARLLERLQAAGPTTRPFRLRLGTLAFEATPETGVFVTVDDLDGGCRALRTELLCPPFSGATFAPHVTVVHPRTSRRGRELWESGAYRPEPAAFTVGDVALTAYDGTRWIVAATVPLGGGRVRVEPLIGPPSRCLEPLIAESQRKGLAFVRRLAEDWTSGANRFDRPGEALLVARMAGEIVGVCGLNVDPYVAGPAVGRVRHLYVLSAARRRGVGADLVTSIVQAARGRFDVLRLRTRDPAAARLYERLGFRATTDVADCSHVMDLR